MFVGHTSICGENVGNIKGNAECTRNLEFIVFGLGRFESVEVVHSLVGPFGKSVNITTPELGLIDFNPKLIYDNEPVS